MRKVSRHTAPYALIISLLVAPLCGTLHATEPGAAPADAPPVLLSSPSSLSRFVTPAAIDGIDRSNEPVRAIGANPGHEEQRGYGYRRGGRGRRSAAATAFMIGAAAAIAGTAVLVYANRPECSVNASFNGCGYGAKVVGGSLLAGGVIGVAVGAALW